LLRIHASALIFVDMSGLTKVQKYFKEILKWLWNKRKENNKKIIKKRQNPFSLFRPCFPTPAQLAAAQARQQACPPRSLLSLTPWPAP